MIKLEQPITYKNKTTGEWITVIGYEYLGDEKILFCTDKKKVAESILNDDFEIADWEHWQKTVTDEMINSLCAQTGLPPFLFGAK